MTWQNEGQRKRRKNSPVSYTLFLVLRAVPNRKTLVVMPASIPDKPTIRRAVWKKLAQEKVARFPFPIEGRIPNFKGAEQAAEKLAQTRVWKRAEVIKVNPDTPQKRVRQIAMEEGKTLIVPTPRLRDGFLLLENVKKAAKKASTIKGATTFGKPLPVENIPEIDLIVNGSVAVCTDGGRAGKGHGYGELEYAICCEMNKIRSSTKTAATVHELQLVDKVPTEQHDVPLDMIVTPERIIATHSKAPKPSGIYWEKITDQMLDEMPVLKELRSQTKNR